MHLFYQNGEAPAPIQRAIMNLDKVTGISVMKIVEKLDAGPTMLKKEIKLNSTMNTERCIQSTF